MFYFKKWQLRNFKVREWKRGVKICKVNNSRVWHMFSVEKLMFHSHWACYNILYFWTLGARLSLPPLLSVNTTPEAREEVSRCCTCANCCPSTKLPCKGEAEFVRPVRLQSAELLLSMITSTGSPSPSPLAVHVSQCGRLIAGLSRLAFLSLTRSFARSLWRALPTPTHSHRLLHKLFFRERCRSALWHLGRHSWAPLSTLRQRDARTNTQGRKWRTISSSFGHAVIWIWLLISW